MLRRTPWCAAFLLCAATALAQPIILPRPDLPRGSARLAGQVVDSNGDPLPRTTVDLFSITVGSYPVRIPTDGDGRFEFRDLPAGDYTVSVWRDGFTPITYGQREPGDPPRAIRVQSDGAVDGIRVVMPRNGVVVGRVLDEFKEPRSRIRVHLIRVRWSDGVAIPLIAPLAASTDDTGAFRIFDVLPGSYYLYVLAAGQYACTYYPGTIDPAQAKPLMIRAGDTIGPMTIQLTPVPLAAVSGTAIGGNGLPIGSGYALARPRVQITNEHRFAGAVKADGTFSIQGLPPGEYRVEVEDKSSPGRRYGAGADVAIVKPAVSMAVVSMAGSDQSGVVLRPVGNVILNGRVVLESSAQSVDRRSIYINYSTAGGSQTTVDAVRMAEDLSFSMIVPAERLLVVAFVGPGQPWTVQAVRVGGIDVTGKLFDLTGQSGTREIEIELTLGGREVSGTVSGLNGEPIYGVDVLIFPEDPAIRGLAGFKDFAGRGRYSVRHLPPGRYLAIALPRSVSFDSGDTEKLERIAPRATRFELGERDVKKVDLTVDAVR